MRSTSGQAHPTDFQLAGLIEHRADGKGFDVRLAPLQGTARREEMPLISSHADHAVAVLALRQAYRKRREMHRAEISKSS
jgi:hypothetical protein